MYSPLDDFTIKLITFTSESNMHMSIQEFTSSICSFSDSIKKRHKEGFHYLILYILSILELSSSGKTLGQEQYVKSIPCIHAESYSDQISIFVTVQFSPQLNSIHAQNYHGKKQLRHKYLSYSACLVR